jgi:hypothetical protein
MSKINIVNINAIVDLKPNIWLVDKKTPDSPIIELAYSELPLLKSVYKKYNHRIFHNGQTYWLNVMQFRAIKEKNLTLNDIELVINYNNKKSITLYKNILSKIDRTIPIVLIEEYVSESTTKSVLETIKNTLEEKKYTINDIISMRSEIEVGLVTSNLILEYLSAKKIKNNKFLRDSFSHCSTIHYYDNNVDRISYLKKINDTLQYRLQVSKPEIATHVQEFVNDKKATFILHIVSNNEVNPLTDFEIKIGTPFKYLKSYEDF